MNKLNGISFQFKIHVIKMNKILTAKSNLVKIFKN